MKLIVFTLIFFGLLFMLWRVQSIRQGRGREQPKSGTQRPSTGSETDRRHALEVLGLPDTASEQDIIEAHRRLMQRLHPDKGGSAHLARELNDAKHILLSEK